jgi:hypothetical protein
VGCPFEGHLSIEPSDLSVEAVLLHNGNECLCVLVSCGVHTKEPHDSMRHLMERIQLHEY